jgi:glutamate-1-semialdehyde 2,1-aminomutase
VGMRAGRATLRRMEAADGWAVLDARTAAFTDTLLSRLAPLAPDLVIARHASIFWLHRTSEAPVRQPGQIPAANAEWYRRFFHAALARGVYLPPSAYEVCFVSLAHDEGVLAEAAAALAAAAKDAR